MIKNLLLCGLLLCAMTFLNAQDLGYINQDVTLTTGTYNCSGTGNINVTIPQGEVVQLNCTDTYAGANLIIFGQLTVNKNPGSSLQVGGNILLGTAANLTVNGSFISSKMVTLGENATFSITKDYASTLNDGKSVHLLTKSNLQVGGNSRFNNGHLIMDAGSVFTTTGNLTLANPESQISGALTTLGTLTISGGTNQLSCPGSITTTNLVNDAAITPVAISGSGFIKITGNLEQGSGNPLTSDATIVVDYNGTGGNIGAATRGASSPCSPLTLPVNLSDFSASYNKGTITLTWQTATEINNKGFYVQRSVDAIHYTTIGFEPSKSMSGNSSVGLAYSFLDPSPELNNYYRLQQMDLNGRVSYSAIIYQPKAGTNVSQTTTVKAYPVPATDYIYFISSAAGRLMIYDLNGRQVLNGMVAAGENKISIQQLKSGIYDYRINNQKGRFIKK